MESSNINRFKNTLQLLKETSEYRNHPNNEGKTYIYTDNELLEIGYDCFSLMGRYYRIVMDGDIIKTRLIQNYILLYGISLLNVCTLLHNRGIIILNISRIIDPEFFRETYYLIIFRDQSNKITSVRYTNAFNDLEKFEMSEIGQIIFNLYNINK